MGSVWVGWGTGRGMDVETFAGRLDADDIGVLLGHYAVAGPIVERLLGGVPFAWTTFPAGPGGPAIYHGPLAAATHPKGPVVRVTTADGAERVYPKLSAERIEGLVRYGAVEIATWSPQPADPLRVGFARVILARDKQTTSGQLRDATIAMGEFLRASGTRGVAVFDGLNGAAIWIPFVDGPTYGEVRAWLHARGEAAATRYPGLLSTQPNTHVNGRVHVHVSTNAVGRFSAVPYGARGTMKHPVSVPISWDGVKAFDGNGPVAGELSAWIARHGEAFGAEVAAIGEHRFSEAWAQRRAEGLRRGPEIMPSNKTHGPIIEAALEVLQDGRSHDAQQILALAVEGKLLDAGMTKKYVYTSLIEYIARARGNGRKPAIVQNGDRSFRVNEPPDEWPESGDATVLEPPPETQALIDRLAASASGGDYAAFEQAVCDAFEMLGFAATHRGGQKAPDGTIDAPLGPCAYRATLECKSANEGINDPGVVEAAKYREPFGAQYCALVARAFTGEIEFAAELHEHGVSAWAVHDLQTLLRVRANPLECRALFAPGFAADALDDLLWERSHGGAKRVRWIAEALVRTGWTTQSAYRGSAAEAPRITQDVAMVLVDQDLRAQGSGATCSRADVSAAFEHLSGPLVARAWRDPSDGSIVLLAPPPA